MLLWLIPLAAGATAAFAVVGAGRLILLPRVAMRDRVAALREPQQRRDVVQQVTQTLLRDRRSSQFEIVEQLFGRSRGDRTRVMLERAGLPLRAGEYMLVRLLVVVLGFVAGMVGTGSLQDPLLSAGGMIGGLVAGLVLPPLYVRHRISRRRALIDAQLVEMTELMASSMESGVGYLQSLITTMEQLDAPLRDELRRLADEVRLGGDIDEALDALKRRLDSRDFDVLATAISIQRTNGGNLASILKGVAITIRDRQAFRREVAALTSRERFSAIIVAGLPFVLVGALTALVPDLFGRLFTDTVGRIVVAAAFGLDVLGYLVIKRVTRIDV